jgi:hypothetical protein
VKKFNQARVNGGSNYDSLNNPVVSGQLAILGEDSARGSCPRVASPGLPSLQGGLGLGEIVKVREQGHTAVAVPTAGRRGAAGLCTPEVR